MVTPSNALARKPSGWTAAELERTRVAFESGRMVGVSRTYSFELTMPGGDIGLRHNSLGMTETMGPHTGFAHPGAPPEEQATPLPERLRGSFGAPLPFIEHKIVDPRRYDLSKRQLRARAKEIAKENRAAEAVRKAIDEIIAAVAASAAAAVSG